MIAPENPASSRQNQRATESPASEHQAPQLDPQVVHSQAAFIREKALTAFVFGINRGSVLAEMHFEAIHEYVETYVSDLAGDNCQKNPLLRTLIEQLLMAHHSSSRLQADAMNSRDLEPQRVKLQQATALMGEIRRLAREIDVMVDKHKQRATECTASVRKASRQAKCA